MVDGPHLTMAAAAAWLFLRVLAGELSARDEALVLADAERLRRAREILDGDGHDR